MNSARLSLLLILPLFVASPTFAQSENTGAAGQNPTYKANVRVVLVDVVVTDNKDEPVTGLTKDRFAVLEDGKQQTLTSFEEHTGIPDAPELSRMAKLPPNVFSNAPLVKTGEAANVLLLDSLNTQMSDQSYVRAEMIKYIKSIRSGTRLAIFTLGDRLRFVQGFTDDPALLMAAMNGKNGVGNPQLSSLLQTPAEQDANQSTVNQMKDLALALGENTGGPQQANALGGLQTTQQGASQPNLQASIDALSRFLKETAGSQTAARVNLTLEAIDQLAMYLRAIPGRKNVIWFTGSFPLATLLTDPNIMRDYGPEVSRMANLLAAARIAIYPVGLGAIGLSPNRIYDFSGPQSPKTVGAAPDQTMTQYQVQSMNQESTERAQSSASLEEMAENTGGQFFVNTNGFSDVLDHVVKTGTNYYTLTYSPTNQNMDGELRQIRVKLDGKYKLAYRRGYYATKDFMSPGLKMAPKGDPLRPLMEHGTPNSTAILYTMKLEAASVQPGTLEPGSGPKRAGDNDKLKGAVERYSLTFTVLPDRLALETSVDGEHQGNMEVTLLVYDRDGTPVNWMVRLLRVRVPREHYEQALVNGVGFNMEIDVPPAGVYLRSGMYDMASSKAGTLEIPMAAVLVSEKH